MAKDKPLLVSSCPLCGIFLNPEENVKTKLYWPKSIEEIPESEFVILDCKTCKVPLVVYRNHVTEIAKDAWGRVLHRCRELFGNSMRLRTHMRTYRDHIHFHLIR